MLYHANMDDKNTPNPTPTINLKELDRLIEQERTIEPQMDDERDYLYYDYDNDNT